MNVLLSAWGFRGMGEGQARELRALSRRLRCERDRVLRRAPGDFRLLRGPWNPPSIRSAMPRLGDSDIGSSNQTAPAVRYFVQASTSM